MRTGADAALKDLKHLNQYDADNKETVKAEDCPRCNALPEGEYCSEVLFTEGKKSVNIGTLKIRNKKQQALLSKLKMTHGSLKWVSSSATQALMNCLSW